MRSRIIQATWQAGLLSATSNILGQAIKCYQAEIPFSINVRDLLIFVLFSFILCPPNFMWQQWLEKQFPGYSQQPSAKVKQDHDASSKTTERKLNVRNTLTKFALDQTLGATVNTLLFLGGIALLRGKSFEVAIRNCQEQFWPLMKAGQKLWPAVSLLSFLVVPVAYRTTFGSIVGMFWNIYLTLFSSRDVR